MEERRNFGYPPYSRIVDICLDDPNPKRLALMGRALGGRLKTALRPGVGLDSPVRIEGPFETAENRQVLRGFPRHGGNQKKFRPGQRPVPDLFGGKIFAAGPDRDETPELPGVIEKDPPGAGIFVYQSFEVLSDRASRTVDNRLSAEIFSQNS